MSNDTKKTLKRLGGKIRAGTIGPVTLSDVQTLLLPALQTLRSKRPRPDALSRLIDGIVSSRPGISESELLDELKRRKGLDVKEKVPGAIEDFDYDDDEVYSVFFIGNDKRSEHAPVSGLKDRLSRAKRDLKSR